MLSEKGLLIIEKLAEHNNELVTSKALLCVHRYVGAKCEDISEGGG